MYQESVATATPQKLTRYPLGSLRELWAISLPLMISLLSGSMMLFLDRMLLAQASIDFLNACTNAGILAQAIQFPFISTTAIAEVFVGQYNGAGKKERLGEPVWQMIWLSVFTTVVFVPLGIFSGAFIFSDPVYGHLENAYFRWILLFGPFFCLATALSTFFIGQGLLKLVTITVVIANLINVGLDLLFIPTFGIAGAAIATGISQIFQCVVLLIAFLSRKNRQEKGTAMWHLKLKSMGKCLAVGLPNAVAHALEIFGWWVFFRMMTGLGHEYITVVAVAQSIFFLFTFITEAVSKGASAIAANLIGAKRWDLVWKLLRSGLRFYIQVFLVLGFVLVIYPDPMIHWFLPAGEENAALIKLVKAACVWVWIFFLFDGITWLVVGLLTAAGDTKFVMKVAGVNVWLFALVPIYIFNVYLGHTADVAWFITAFYGFMNALIFLARFRTEKWKAIQIT
jgi:MATE family multidrug resistance protein